MGEGEHEASHESSAEEPAGLLVYQMYHIGVAWRGEVREDGRVRMIHHLFDFSPAKVCTQLEPHFESHASSKRGCARPLASQELWREPQWRQRTRCSEISSRLSISVRSAGGPPFQPQT